MPAHKKDPSTRRRRNKSPSRATLTRAQANTVEDFDDLTVSQLRDLLKELNQSRPADQQLPVRGTKAVLLERVAAASSPVPPLPAHPPRVTSDGEAVPVEWDPQTRAWWHDVWTSPMATEWDESDVHNVLVVALLYDDIWAARDAKSRKDALAEYRLQRADLGLSPYSRRRLEWTIETAAEAKDRGQRRRASAPKPPTAGKAGSKELAADPRSVLTLVQ